MKARLVVAATAAVALLASGAGAAQVPSLRLLANSPKPRVISSDLAFWGSIAYASNYDGFRVIDISKPGTPVVLADVRCHGPQNDISVWEHLVFLSVDRPQTTAGCDSDDAKELTDPTAFEGIRIFDATDPRNPRLVASVPTDCGSHTHTLVPDLAHARILLYVSSYALRAGPHCGAGREENPLHGKISIVAVPVDAPETAAVVATPAINAPTFGGSSPEFAAPTVGCHDISVFMPLHLAAAACMSEGQIWDTTDPLAPKVRAHITNRSFEFWHSATFSPDGKTVVFGDESLTGSCHRAGEPDGRLWFYSVARPAKPVASFLVRPLTTEYCSVHMFNTLPVKGRNVLVSGWYDGGARVIDFTNPAKPRQLAASLPEGRNEWSSYWYDGSVFSSDIDRGFDVFALDAATSKGARRLGHLNPQTQEILIR